MLLGGEHVEEYVSESIVPVEGSVSKLATPPAERKPSSIPMPVTSMASPIAMDSDGKDESTMVPRRRFGRPRGFAGGAGDGAAATEEPPFASRLYEGDFVDVEDVIIDEEEALDLELRDGRIVPAYRRRRLRCVEFAETWPAPPHAGAARCRAAERDPMKWPSAGPTTSRCARGPRFGGGGSRRIDRSMLHTGSASTAGRLSQLIRGDESEEEGAACAWRLCACWRRRRSEPDVKTMPVPRAWRCAARSPR